LVFDELLSVVSPPKQPIDAHGDWGEVVTRLGFSLPVDYMQFVDSFGSGSLNDFVWVFNPFATNNNLNFLYQLTRTLGGLRVLKERHPELVPHPLLFEPGGLVPWGVTDNGDTLCWITEGETGHWQTVVLPRHASTTTKFNMPMTTFLTRLLSGKLVCDGLPSSLSSGTPYFKPARAGPQAVTGQQSASPN
jgi:hypothetical protein